MKDTPLIGINSIFTSETPRNDGIYSYRYVSQSTTEKGYREKNR